MLYKGDLNLYGNRFTTYHIVLPKFERFDVMEYGAEFQVDVGSIYYSMFIKGKMRQTGDTEIKEDLDALRQSLTSAVGETESTAGWEDGVYRLTTTKRMPDGTSLIVKYNNGTLYSTEYYGLEASYIERTESLNWNLELAPINAKSYEVVELNKKTSKSESGIYYSLDALKRRFGGLKHIEAADYDVINSIVETENFLRELSTYPDDRIIGIDFETTGLRFNCSGHEEVTGLVVSTGIGNSRYFAFISDEFDVLPRTYLYKLLDELKRFTLVAFNKKFEYNVLTSLGYKNYPIKHDPYLLSCLNNVQARFTHDLKTLSTELTQHNFLSLPDIFLNPKEIHFEKLPKDIVRYYACPDADNELKVLKDLLSKLPRHMQKLYELEVKLADIIAEGEYWGYRINFDSLQKGYIETAQTVEHLEKIIHKLTKSDINISSPKQLGEYLYKKLRAPVLVRTKKTLQPSTGKAAIKKLASVKRQGGPLDIFKDDIYSASGAKLLKASQLNEAAYPVVLVIKEYVAQKKLLSAFYERFNAETDGDRYFSWFRQIINSGRQASPMHQLPKNIKKFILADSEDHVLIDADYSQVELRLLASIAGERKLVESMKDPEIDIHRVIANLITGIPIWQITSKMRQGFKQTNFGVVYLIGAKSLAEQIHGVGVAAPLIEESAKSISNFYRTFPRIKTKMMEVENLLLSQGVSYTKFGRARYFPEILHENVPKFIKAKMIREANNHPIQGTAADIMKLAEVKLQQWMKDRGWDELIDTPQGRFPKMRIMLSAHDEVLISAHKSLVQNVPEIYRMVKECMEFQIEDWAPLYTSCCIVDNWAEGKNDAFAIPVKLRDKIIEEGTLRLGDNPKQEMLEIIDTYDKQTIAEFMADEIKKANGAVPLITHPVYSHTLIGQYGPDKSFFVENPEATQEEVLLISAKNYMSQVSVQEPQAQEQEEQEALTNSILDFSEADLAAIDDLGNLNQSSEEDDEEIDVTEEDDYNLYSKDLDKVCAVVQLFDTIVVNAQGLLKSDVDELLQLLAQESEPDGFCKIMLDIGQMIDTNLRADSLNASKFGDWIAKRKEIGGIL